MRIEELVKTYKLINDPEAPAWNVKFAGIAVAGVLVVAAIAGVSYQLQDQRPANAFQALSAHAADGSRIDYVGYDPASFDPALGLDGALIERALDNWARDHRGATVLDQEPVHSHGFLIGYRIHYVPVGQ